MQKDTLLDSESPKAGSRLSTQRSMGHIEEVRRNTCPTWDGKVFAFRVVFRLLFLKIWDGMDSPPDRHDFTQH
jgi:hypothetical protein